MTSVGQFYVTSKGCHILTAEDVTYFSPPSRFGCDLPNLKLKCGGRHLKWPYLGGKPPFFRFQKKNGKVVKNHPIYWFFENSVKTSGFLSNIAIFFKIRGNEWFVTTFSGFIKKTEKVVVFRLNMAIFGAHNRLLTTACSL